jgi:hypothetical protein
LQAGQTVWEEMKEKLGEEYLPQSYRTKHLYQSHHDNFLDQRNNLRQWNKQSIAEFEENKMTIRTISSPNTVETTIKQTLENLMKVIQDMSENIKEIKT